MYGDARVLFGHVSLLSQGRPTGFNKLRGRAPRRVRHCCGRTVRNRCVVGYRGLCPVTQTGTADNLRGSAGYRTADNLRIVSNFPSNRRSGELTPKARKRPLGATP